MTSRMLRWSAVFTLGLVLLSSACRGATATSPKPGGGALVNSDSVVKVKIQSITAQATGYSWNLEVLVQSAQDVDSLVNPVKDSVGKTVTVLTDQDMKPFKAGDVVSGRIKYTGDVNTPGGVNLYLYQVAPAT